MDPLSSFSVVGFDSPSLRPNRPALPRRHSLEAMSLLKAIALYDAATRAFDVAQHALDSFVAAFGNDQVANPRCSERVERLDGKFRRAIAKSHIAVDRVVVALLDLGIKPGRGGVRVGSRLFALDGCPDFEPSLVVIEAQDVVVIED